MSGGRNPFAGLRPYDVEESYLFFGRDRVVDQLLHRLGDGNFLGVLGPSGSGKSSVVRAGLIPALEGGRLRRAGERWRIAILRPGGDPFENLCEALAGQQLLGPDLPPDQARAIIRSRLRRGSRGLDELLRRSALGPRENLLVLVDQFEEVFRFAAEHRQDVENDAAAFVRLLLGGRESANPRLFVALTMRSDFLGDCSRFRGLAEALSDSMFLVPEMTRSERKQVIVGPVAIGGAKLEPRLLTRLMNEADDTPDQLPVLQHALQQTWEHAQGALAAGRPLDFEHYDGAGTVAGALHQHAESALAELAPEQRALARKLFQTITVLGPDNRGVRRPTRLSSIAQIVGVSVPELAAVIEPFRRDGRGFVMPRVSEEATLSADSVIDISHESLMRGWGTLKQWVVEEAESVATWRRLAQTAAEFPDDPEWRYLDPALTAALHWRTTMAPTRAWGLRYEANFDQAMAFLDRSRDVRDAAAAAAVVESQRKLEEAEKLAAAEHQAALLARRNEQRTRVFLVAALFLMVLALVASALAFVARKGALRDRELAEQKADEAEVAAADARGKEAKALRAQQAAVEAQQAAVEAQREAEKAHDETLIEKQKAVDAEKDAQEQAVRADAQAKAARAAGKAAALATAKAEVGRATVLLRLAEGGKGEHLAGALAAVGGVLDQGSDLDLQASLHELLATYGGTSFTLSDRVRTVALDSNGRVLVGVDGDGAVLLPSSGSEEKVPLRGGSGAVRVVAMGPAGTRAAVANDDGSIQLWGSTGEEVATLDAGDRVLAMAFSAGDEWLAATTRGGGVGLWNASTGASQGPIRRTHDYPAKAVAVFASSPPVVASGGDDGRVCVLHGVGEEPARCRAAHEGWVQALSFHPTGRVLASAGEDGQIRIYDGWQDPAANPADWLSGSAFEHQGPATSVQWSDDGRTLLSSSWDGTARLTDRRSPARSLTFRGHRDWVWMARGVWEDGQLQRVVTASEDGVVRVFGASGEMEREFVGEGAGIREVAVDPSGRWLVWAGGRSETRVVDLAASLDGGLPGSLPDLVATGCEWLVNESFYEPICELCESRGVKGAKSCSG